METDRTTDEARVKAEGQQQQQPAAKPNGSGGQHGQAAPASGTPPPEKLELSTLKDMSVGALTKIAKGLDVPGATGMRKQELIFEILRRAPRRAA